MKIVLEAKSLGEEENWAIIFGTTFCIHTKTSNNEAVNIQGKIYLRHTHTHKHALP